MTSVTRFCSRFYTPARMFSSIPKPAQNLDFNLQDMKSMEAELNSLKGRVEELEKKQFSNTEIELKKLATQKEIEFKKLDEKGANLATVLIVGLGSGFAFFMATR